MSEAGATAWRPGKTQENCFQSSVSRNQGLIRLASSRISSKSVTRSMLIAGSSVATK